MVFRLKSKPQKWEDIQHIFNKNREESVEVRNVYIGKDKCTKVWKIEYSNTQKRKNCSLGTFLSVIKHQVIDALECGLDKILFMIRNFVEANKDLVLNISHR